VRVKTPVKTVAPIKLPAVSAIAIPEKMIGIGRSLAEANEESKERTTMGNPKPRA